MLELLKWEKTRIGGIGGMMVYKAIVGDGKRMLRYVIRNWGRLAGVELDVQKGNSAHWESIAVYQFWTVKAAKEKAEATLWDWNIARKRGF